MSKNPTLRDIAKLADVSLSTVSLVLNNKANVTPEMRQKVLDAAGVLGYRPKVVGHTPIANGLTTIGVLAKKYHADDYLIANPFYSYVIAGIERECQRNHINLMYAQVDVDEHGHTLQLPTMLTNELVDGIIVLGAFLEVAVADISHRVGQNIVLLDAYTTHETVFDTVAMDNQGGAFKAVSYLIENQHRHIGLIGSNPQSYPSVLERRQGYLQALAQHGIQETYIEDGLLERTNAITATQRLLQRAPQITAIFACNDETAVGVMGAVRQLGYNVPRDISVVGFDDIDLAQEIVPALTTVHVDKVLMGTMALRLLRDRLQDTGKSSIKTTISTQLMIRDSVQRRHNS